MREFIIEEQIEKVVNPITREYLKEVISSYNDQNYRSAILVLYTTIIYDLLHKLTVLSNVYNDAKASEIIQNIKEQQKNEPKNPDWEKKLIEQIYSSTELISAVEKEQLLNIKNERNYVAHPIIDFNSEKLELKSATKETAKDLIRKGFEIVFLKDAILGKKIVIDIILELNDYYDRANVKGLETFLKSKYFNRMKPEHKDDLFKTLWKFTFIIDNEECIKNRQANYWGLSYLYKENSSHYKTLIKNDIDYYLNNLNIETFNLINGITLREEVDKYYNSRIMTLIRFIQEDNSIYKIFNDHAKNIIENTVNYAFIQVDIETTKLYEIGGNPYKDSLFREQIILKSEAIFLVNDIDQHFKKIRKMISNYCTTSENWFATSNYNVIGEQNLRNIYNQIEYRGAERQFIKFLISYCMDASSYYQAESMFKYMEKYTIYFDQNDFYKILLRMNNNSQYSENHEIRSMLQFMEDKFEKLFNYKLIEMEEEKYLYSKLYNIKWEEINGKYDNILNIIEKRAQNYNIWSLWYGILEDLVESMKENEVKFKESICSYPNILKIITNKEDPNYRNRYLREFERGFLN